MEIAHENFIKYNFDLETGLINVLLPYSVDGYHAPADRNIYRQVASWNNANIAGYWTYTLDGIRFSNDKDMVKFIKQWVENASNNC